MVWHIPCPWAVLCLTQGWWHRSYCSIEQTFKIFLIELWWYDSSSVWFIYSFFSLSVSVFWSTSNSFARDSGNLYTFDLLDLIVILGFLCILGSHSGLSICLRLQSRVDYIVLQWVKLLSKHKHILFPFKSIKEQH